MEPSFSHKSLGVLTDQGSQPLVGTAGLFAGLVATVEARSVSTRPESQLQCGEAGAENLEPMQGHSVTGLSQDCRNMRVGEVLQHFELVQASIVAGESSQTIAISFPR